MVREVRGGKGGPSQSRDTEQTRKKEGAPATHETLVVASVRSKRAIAHVKTAQVVEVVPTAGANKSGVGRRRLPRSAGGDCEGGFSAILHHAASRLMSCGFPSRYAPTARSLVAVTKSSVATPAAGAAATRRSYSVRKWCRERAADSLPL